MKRKLFLALIVISFVSSCASLKILWEKNSSGENKLCFTFDDGPNNIATKKLIKVLDKYKVPATFFIIGQNIENNTDLLKELDYKGYNIGNHSYDHDNFLFLKSTQEIKDNILKTNNLISRITGKTPILFRPPNALVNEKMILACKELDMKLVGVNIFVNDSMTFNEESIFNAVKKEIKGGTNILVLHDGFGTFESKNRVFVAKVVEKLIRKLKKEGYQFGKINELGMCN
ncbi:MAG: polysaccharide deacetylase family protein [Candidatus Sericytochromatia bacterium]